MKINSLDAAIGLPNPGEMNQLSPEMQMNRFFQEKHMSRTSDRIFSDKYEKIFKEKGTPKTSERKLSAKSVRI